MLEIVGRKDEIVLLQDALQSNQSELVAVYGRRRIGKTFLIREFFHKKIVFEVVGLSKGSMKEQLDNFCKQLYSKNKGRKNELVYKWQDAFTQLERYIDSIKSKQKKVIFIDEFPWIATPKSNFLLAFENFWNSYCTKRKDLVVVICGSAASYIVKNIIKNKAGLHNRITRTIRLLPFNLNETKLFLNKKGIKYTDYDIIRIYMCIGGIPHYLDKLKKGVSVAQNIDELCFKKNGVLNEEFKLLFSSLFNDSEKHENIIKALAINNKGLTRNELIIKSKNVSGGDFSLKLEELIESGFVSEFNFYQNKQKLTLYRLSDEYSRFYLKFIEKHKNGGSGTFIRLERTSLYTSWAGFAFETICLKHIDEIKKGLKIEAVYSTSNSWFNKNAQIDLLIDRDDNIINICEIKFYNTQFVIDKTYYMNLKNKAEEFKLETSTRKNIHITLISVFGLKENKYSKEIVQNSLTIDSLFNQ